MAITTIRPSTATNAGQATSPVVRAGDLLFTGGLVALDDDGVVRGDLRAQAHTIFRSLGAILDEAGGSLDDVVSVVAFQQDVWDFDAVLDVAREYFPHDPPAWTPVGFVGCQHPGAALAVRAIAHLGAGAKQCLVPDSQAWLRQYPVSAACRKGDLVFIAGQTGANAEGAVEEPFDHRGQAHVAYERMLEVLAQAGGTVDDLLDFTSYHLDIRGAPGTFDDVYVPEVIGRPAVEDSPTTSHVGATALHRPGMLGAYTAIADLRPGQRKGVTPDSVWWKETHPLGASTRKPGGSLITLAGHVAAQPDGSTIHPGDPAGQLRYILDSMGESLEGYGLSFADVVEITAFGKDPRFGGEVARVLAEYFTAERPPALSYLGMTALWLEGFQLEVAGLAYAG